MPLWIGGQIGTAVAAPTAKIVQPSTGSLTVTGLAPTVSVGATVSFRTMIGSNDLIQSRWGQQPTPDTAGGDTDGASFGVAGGKLDDARTKGAALMVKITGTQSNTQAADGSFSVSIWNGLFDTWASDVEAQSGGLTRMRNAVRDGVFRAIYMLDDFTTGGGTNNYLNAVTYTEIEAIAAHVKARWAWMPCMVRGPNIYLKSTASASGASSLGRPRINGVRQYAYLDSGYLQYRPRLDGAVGAAIASNVQAGIDCGLGLIGGANLLDQGKGTTPGWGCKDYHIVGKCCMSPTEVREAGLAFLASPTVVGFNLWAYSFGIPPQSNPTIWGDPAIQAAMQDNYNASIGRPEGQINIRGDLVAA